MFAITKHKLNSQVTYQRISFFDVNRIKDKGAVVFDDERMAEYAVCYINKLDLGTWTQDIERHGKFEYDIKLKRALFVADNPSDFNGCWVAFMVRDVSFQLKMRGVDGDRFSLHSPPYDMPLTPWVIIKAAQDNFVLVSASDGRVVGASHQQEELGDFNSFITHIGGSFCGGHMETLTPLNLV